MPLGWSVIKELLAVRRRLDAVLEEIEGEVDVPDLVPPPTDLYESEREIAVIIELPGVDPESIEVQLQEDRLRVAGQYARSEPTSETRWLRMERPTGQFQREFALVGRDIGSPTTGFERGVLIVRLPLIAAEPDSTTSVQEKEVES